MSNQIKILYTALERKEEEEKKEEKKKYTSPGIEPRTFHVVGQFVEL